MGRDAGIPNKNKAFLMNRLQDMYGKDFHPIMQMAKNASTLQAIADVHADGAITVNKDDAGKVDMIDATSSSIAATAAWEKIAPYVEPKLTATTMDITATEITHEQWVASLNDSA
jgi:hypothetical protein